MFVYKSGGTISRSANFTVYNLSGLTGFISHNYKLDFLSSDKKNSHFIFRFHNQNIVRIRFYCNVFSLRVSHHCFLSWEFYLYHVFLMKSADNWNRTPVFFHESRYLFEFHILDIVTAVDMVQDKKAVLSAYKSCTLYVTSAQAVLCIHLIFVDYISHLC